MGNQISAISLQVLNHAENTSNQDNETRDVEDPEVSPPRDITSLRYTRRCKCNSTVEEHGCDDEEAKDANLTQEAGNDDLFTNLVKVQRPARLNTSTACLEGEGNDIASDKDPCNPVDWN